MLLLFKGRWKEKRFKESCAWEEVNSFTGRKISQMKNTLKKGKNFL